MSSSLKNKVAQKPITLLLLLTAVFIAQSQPAQAASSCAGTADCHIQVSFGGEYVEDTCEVSINGASSAESVSLPTLSTSKLNIDGAEAGNQEFQIALKLCPVNRSVDLRFIAAGSSRSPDVVTGNLQNELADDYSRNVQVRLSKATGQQMFVGEENSVQEYVIPATGEDITHYFLAGYYAKGTNAVTPGQVKATAGIELVYK
ncbi:fimbrial protein [Yersinia similis]|uniref:Fimbrial protein n=1 Tax=Yersinia similis TaxID=367190 RepID=A0A0T9QX45_9GAMM|nr:fimbrial protein [Yersinia similis]AHK21772.1 fimbrial protein [Yersinia similis]CFQ61379.1 fimbrial protein [Yersinia similis]CNB86211.1 fimbrial protein [Yersinia similis]CNE60592.1 fimbrial protein [Yersinia similis]CNG20819.1 fimbrial protein [Yersinia similis]